VEAQRGGARVVLLVPLDAESRVVHGTQVHAVDAREAARLAGVPVVGLPVHAGGPGLGQLLADAEEVLRSVYGAAEYSWQTLDSLGDNANAWADVVTGIV